jgi:hypothetical protein
MGQMRKIVRALVPAGLRRLRHRALLRLEERRLARLSPAQIFAQVYAAGTWGGEPGQDYFSGSGSHRPECLLPYVEAVRRFAASFSPPLDAADLGCGDFNVGQRIRDCFGAYRARDVVPALIERNREHFAGLDVDFACSDIAAEPLPPGDLVMIRQVLQHLSNREIAAIAAKLCQYRFAIVTEHVPAKPGFTANIDKPTSARVRMGRAGIGIPDSGVVLTEPPFALAVKSARILCETPDAHGPDAVLRTMLYELG